MSGDSPIAIAAGGTGGHLFPAQALAQELIRRNHKIVLLTEKRVKHFDRLFPGIQVRFVPAATPSRRSMPGKALAFGTILWGVLQSLKLLGAIKPAVVIGFGGYPTLPPLIAAKLRRIPTCIHEQNAVLGRANRVLAPYVDAIASTFPSPKHLRSQDRVKLVTTGNPVRDAVIASAATPYNPPQSGGPLRLLIFGGSQGAKVLSTVVPEAVVSLPTAIRQRLQVTQQCRPEDLEYVRSVYAAARMNTELATFFDDMPKRIAGSHLVIARSGASTATELAVIGRPAILVPLSYALDDDQKANAMILDQAGAAWMIEEKELSAEGLRERLITLFDDPNKLTAAAAAARALGKPQAVLLLADLVERLAAREQSGSVRACGRPASPDVASSENQP